MSDFETHPVGTRFEIKASRELAREIEQVTQQYGAGIIPNNVYNAYLKLLKTYNENIERDNV